jgi:hypothetical protein
MDALTSSLAVLTAMITPAVLISASGTMILSTSTRLGRVVDRVRSLSDRLRELANKDVSIDSSKKNGRCCTTNLTGLPAVRAYSNAR